MSEFLVYELRSVNWKDSAVNEKVIVELFQTLREFFHLIGLFLKFDVQIVLLLRLLSIWSDEVCAENILDDGFESILNGWFDLFGGNPKVSPLSIVDLVNHLLEVRKSQSDLCADFVDNFADNRDCLDWFDFFIE